MNRNHSMVTFAALTVILFSGIVARAVTAPEAAAPSKARIERGAYLVRHMGCNDCHTPLKLGPRGPEPDMTRALTGHPEGLVMPPAPALPPGPWGWVGAATNTAFAGPWGVSFTANLTPDKETGLNMSERNFVIALKSGAHLGTARTILPPMPWQWYGQLGDEALKDIYAYLQTIPPLKNQVPAPIPPDGK